MGTVEDVPQLASTTVAIVKSKTFIALITVTVFTFGLQK